MELNRLEQASTWIYDTGDERSDDTTSDLTHFVLLVHMDTKYEKRIKSVLST